MLKTNRAKIFQNRLFPVEHPVDLMIIYFLLLGSNFAHQFINLFVQGSRQLFVHTVCLAPQTPCGSGAHHCVYHPPAQRHAVPEV